MTFPLSAPIPFPYFHTCIFPHFHISTLKISPAIFLRNANSLTPSRTGNVTTASSTARPRGGSGTSFGVAGFHARKSPAGLRARPIGNIGTGNISTLATFPSSRARRHPGKGSASHKTFTHHAQASRVFAERLATCEAFAHRWCAHRTRTAKLLRTRQRLGQ